MKVAALPPFKSWRCFLWQQNGIGLGSSLEVKKADLDVIEKNYPRDAERCMIEMFDKWLGSDTNLTYETLARALAAVEERKLVDSVHSAHGI